ncbi:MAG: hypothetical protein RR655_06390, partial [Raoultibacter sp.]
EFFATREPAINNWGGNDIFKSMCSSASGPGSSGWWERSCTPGYSRDFLRCPTDGNPGSGDNVGNSLGVVLGFSL